MSSSSLINDEHRRAWADGYEQAVLDAKKITTLKPRITIHHQN
jgi:hypothetical protein